MTIADAIAQMENVNPSYNNPGALTASMGYCSNGKTSKGIVKFCTPQDGQNAENSLIAKYSGNGYSLQSMLNAWAPASVPGNDPILYANTVAGQVGIDPNVSLDSLSGDLVYNDSGTQLGIDLFPTLDQLTGGVGIGVGTGVISDSALAAVGLPSLDVIAAGLGIDSTMLLVISGGALAILLKILSGN